MRLRFLTLLVAVGLMGGCAEYSSASEPQANDEAPPPADGSSDDTVYSAPSADSGGAAIPPASYYALNLGFELVGGTVDASGEMQYPALSVELYSGGVEPEVVCRHDVPILPPVVETSVPNGVVTEMVVWWELDLDTGVPNDLCEDWPARTWWIGLGPYDRRLDPMMAERGSLGFDVYGLYLQEDLADEVYIVGMAGTNAMISGEVGLTVLEGPLPDGQYQAESLLLMSLD